MFGVFDVQGSRVAMTMETMAAKRRASFMIELVNQARETEK